MRKILCALILAVVTGQSIAPAFALDNINIMSTTSGWRRHSGGAVMAYMRIPTGDNRRSDAQPRVGLKLVTGRSYGRDEIAMHVNNPAIVDIGFTGRSLSAPWAPTLNIGQTVIWTTNPYVLPPTQRLRFLQGADKTWPAVGLKTAGSHILRLSELK